MMMRMSRSLPAALCASLIALCGAPAGAQPARPPSPPGETSAMTDKARDLYVEGQKSAARDRWGEAHAAWLAAWGLKRHYQIAGSLGTAEAKLGRYRDAAEHLSFFMREAPATKVKERQSVQELLAEVRKHVGALVLKVEPAGAEVLVDGVVVGKAPLAEEVFVDVGAREIEARLDGYEAAKAKVDAAAGASREVALTLVKSVNAAARGATDSGSSAGAGRVTEAAPNANDGHGASHAGDAGSAGGAAVKGGPRKEVIIAGIVVSALAVGAGISFAVVSGGKASDADERLTSLRQQVGDPNPCWPGREAAGCDELHGLVEGREVFGNLALWSIVAGTAVGAGTAVYAVMASRPPATKSSAMKNDVAVTPFVTNSAAGVAIRGAW